MKEKKRKGKMKYKGEENREIEKKTNRERKRKGQ